ncbi:homoserine kinase [Stackebrandtia albiflava]|uniref:Homoserine kinase n=1 Tax=Stackebrandtia albiflava TaxID=406432 RepID=A0A562V3P8_9ACTN|nr:homoserine kinase [Stackebrandtia albiflava]TWJ12452.1 homoserine kinase [Stackebrandtia albiflava]
MTRFATEPVTVRVPATSANLGAGFDCLGLALSMYDEVTAEVTTGETVVTVEGEGSGRLAVDESHLVVASLRAACDAFGVAAPNVRLRCRNAIPQARGLGSSSAAIVAGVSLAAELLADVTVDPRVLLRVAAELEGHPDNVAPCLLGGFTVAWTGDDGAHAVRMDPAAGIAPVVYLPAGQGFTSQARAALPGRVPHTDAVFNLSRAALAVHAFTTDPSLLLAATDDRLHQRYRGEVMPRTLELVEHLREAGIPAAVSGAGPSVLAFGQLTAPPDGFTVVELGVSEGVTRL